MKVLITGAGGPGSEALAKKWNHHEIIFADINIQRIHPSIPRQSCIEIPRGTDPDFHRDIGLFIREMGIEVVVSQVDEELEVLNQLRSELGTFDLVSPDLDFVRICNNKAVLGENLRDRGIIEPNTEILSPDTQMRLSNMIFKPSFGRGGRGVFIFRHDSSFESLKEYLLSTKIPYIVQDEIFGEEYTVQVMANRQGKLKAIVPVQVFEKHGSTTSCSINLNQSVMDTVKMLHNTFNPVGTYNVQSIVDAQTNENYIIEINPRVSTTLCLSLECGLDPIELFFDDTESFRATKNELCLNRHWTNFFQDLSSKKANVLFNIMILGGTRFLGRALCESLVSSGNKVSVSSRRRLPIELPITQYTCERLDLRLNKINLSEFDYVIDFTAYRPEDLEMLPIGVPTVAYVLISTDWISRLDTLNSEPRTQLSERNLKYTLEKSHTEMSALDKFASKTLILRLPVALGLNDHHNRLGFYWARARSNKHQLLVEDNFDVSFILVSDFILAFERILSLNQVLPQRLTVRSKTESYNNLVHSFNLAYQKPNSFIQYTSLSRSEISENFPVFASVDPLLSQDLIIEPNTNSLICESNYELTAMLRTQISMSHLTTLQLQALEEERIGLNDRF